jgi:hypothetical protein
MTSFVVMDCTLLTRMSGLPPAFNLRDLRDRIASCSDNVLYHHFCETPLRATFDDPEYRNDFAVWARNDLADKILSEKLGIIDPYEIESMTELKHQVIDIIDDRMSELSPWVPAVRPGREFFFMEALTVAFETDIRVARPADMADAVRAMTNGSIFFHYLEALKRPPVHEDDFTAWFKECDREGEPYARAIAGIEVYFKSLPALRDSLYRALHGVKEVTQ